jgi:ribose transport system permease protein
MAESFKAGNLLQRLGPVVALLLLIFVAWLIDKDGKFLTVRNFENILRQNAAVGVIALGMTFVIILGGIDLSVGSLTALLGGVGIMAMNRVMEANWSESTSIVAAVATMLLVGPLLGALSGVLITKGRITPFIATLGAMAIYRSLTLVFKDGGEYRAQAANFASLASPEWMGDWARRFTAVIFFALAIVLSVLLKKTWFGTAVHAVGDNETAARYAGIRVDRVKIMTYALSGLMCGIAALIVSTRMNSIASAQTGQLYELDAIAAVVVGGASMRGGFGSIWGTVIGVLILGVVNNMLNMISSSETLKSLGLEGVNIAHLQGLVKGVIIIAAVVVQRQRS